MNTALIFAGGVGERMTSASIPKQFLEVNGKPIIIHTLEVFDSNPSIDEIIVVCLESWIGRLRNMLKKFKIAKVVDIVPGGSDGQESIFFGLEAARKRPHAEDDIVLIHDGVRPLITDKTIEDNLENVKKYGNSITTSPSIETIITTDKHGGIKTVVDRDRCQFARAPQCFRLDEIAKIHEQARKDGNVGMVDSATLAMLYGLKLHMTLGPADNLKITTPSDYYTFKAMLDYRETLKL